MRESLNRIRAFLCPQTKNPAGGSQQGFDFTTAGEVEMKHSAHSNTNGAFTQTSKASLAWLNLRLNRGVKEKFAEFGVLTPDLAAVLLNLKSDNRGLTELNVDQYARDIVAGRWHLNGEPIILSSCGKLNNGQHRCHAVIRTGKNIPALFVFGVSHESRLTTDQGKQKTAGDYLAMGGVLNANNLAAIAGAVLQYEQLGRMALGGTERPNKSEVRERVVSDPNIERSYKAVYKKGATKVATVKVLGVAHYIFSRVDEESADRFMASLISGAELRERDPIHVAREKLIDPFHRLNINEQLKTMFMAWNNWRAGKTVRSLTHSMQRGEQLPEVK